MATFGELTALVLDELKISADDSYFNHGHVRFLLGKYRAFLLKQRYSDIKKEIPNSNYQSICVDLELEEMGGNSPCGHGQYLRSIQKIPFSLSVIRPKVSTIDFFGTEITYVNWSRFRYLGNNKYLNNFIYATIGPDNYLYLKSQNPQYVFLQKSMITGIFENIDEAATMSCNESGENIDCDEDNIAFPLEEALIPPMIQLVVQELTGSIYRPKDNNNNSDDDLSGVPVSK